MIISRISIGQKVKAYTICIMNYHNIDNLTIDLYMNMSQFIK